MSKYFSKIDELLLCAEYWDIRNDGTYLASVVGDANQYIFNKSDLVTRNPLLPFIIESLKRRPNPHIYPGRYVADAAWVYASLRIRELGSVVLKDEYGEDLILSKIETLSVLENTDYTYSVSGYVVDTVYVEHGGEQIQLVTNEIWLEFKTKAEAMNLKFPGWDKRWLLGKELGLDDHTLFQHAFSTQSIQHVAMREITFG